MASADALGWRVPAEEYEKFLRFVEDKRGHRDRYAWVFIENAMREWLDADDAAELEAMVDEAIRAGGVHARRAARKRKI